MALFRNSRDPVLFITAYVWSLGCFLALVAVLSLFHINVPSGDHLALIPDLERWFEGEYRFSYLVRQHNEHRIFIPRLVLLTTAVVSNWNTHIEVFLNAIVGAFIFLLWVSLFRSTIAATTASLPFLISVASVFTFSFSQWENWSCGWQIQIFLAEFGILYSITSLTTKPLSPKQLFTAIVASMLATWSFSVGALAWVVGAGILLSRSDSPMRSRYLCWWFGVMTLNLAMYLWGYERPLNQPSVMYVLMEPINFTKYLFTLLGSSVSLGSYQFSEGLGAIGIITTLVLFAKSPSLLFDDKRRAYGWICISSLVIACVLSVGRAGYGIPQALAGRYVTLTVSFWLSLATLLLLSVHRNRSRLYVALSLVALLVVLQNILILPELFNYREKMITARSALASETEEWRLLEGVSQWPDKEVPNARRVLQSYKLSVFKSTN